MLDLTKQKLDIKPFSQLIIQGSYIMRRAYVSNLY